MRKIIPVEQLANYVGQETEPTEWFTVDQERINKFAEATLDYQFIHVDPEKAKLSPFGTTIAHGFLSLSLLPYFMVQTGFVPAGVQMGVNYGMGKVRFLQPVKVNSQLRAKSKLLEITQKGPGQILCNVEMTLEIKDEKKPALIAESLILYFVA